MNSATTATKTQCIEQITQLLDAVVVSSPRVWPRYPNATHAPHVMAPLAVSQSMAPRRAAATAPGARARKATEKRVTAYSDESIPGSAMMSLAAAKLDAHNAHRIATTPFHANDSTADIFSSAILVAARPSASAKRAASTAEEATTISGVTDCSSSIDCGEFFDPTAASSILVACNREGATVQCCGTCARGTPMRPGAVKAAAPPAMSGRARKGA
mmetsp:Transcript_52221/g.156741  ORF Transcript_52221/g.156741 Transcript_52221/m.156741 type:complete len:215 (-) Transcript_52221:276-920(-)